MAVQVSYPGVYIEEFAPGAPIAGVGTGTAAFVGVASKGELDVPTKLASWESFQDIFGDPVPGYYLWYAVRGFFENGGQLCYVVRASNGVYESLVLPDRAGTPGNDLIRVRARQPGDRGIEVAVAIKHLLADTDTELYAPTGDIASLTERELTMEEDVTAGASAADVAARFRPGDWVTVEDGGERVQVVRVSGAAIRVEPALTGSYSAGDGVRLAAAPAGHRIFRVSYSAGLVPTQSLVSGTVLTLNPGLSGEEAHVVDAVQTEYIPGGVTYRVTFRDGLRAPLDLGDPANPPKVQSEEFDLSVKLGSTQTYANLSVDAAHPRYYLATVNGDPSGLITVEPVEPPPTALLPASLPGQLASTQMSGGADEDLPSLGEGDFIDALATLESVDDVNLVAVPDSASPAVQQAVIQHCELLADRFAVLDAQPGLRPFGTGAGDSIEEQRLGLASSRGYGAVYYPWLKVRPAGSGEPIRVPPSGHVCGIIARSDSRRGVHKAPANEIVNGAVGLELGMSDVEQGQLNLQGINVIRSFAGGRPVLWGARTTATDTNWQYVNIRRLFLYLEESIEEGVRWAVFEPNNLQLWQKLKRTVDEFLNRTWRSGALFGATPEEAYYCRIDETLNPFSERALGRLTMEIGVSPSYPAEFVVVRIGIWEGGAAVTES
jgi:phage tail sheath protein FI